MGYVAILDGSIEDVRIASIAGYGDMIEWVDSLEKGKFPALDDFVENGYSANLKTLKADINSAKSLAPADVKTIIKNILGAISRVKTSIAVEM